jgi:ATP-dependent protease ClpP protease subunit
MKYDFYITGTIGVAFDWWTGQRGTTAAMLKSFLDEHKNKECNILVSSPGGLLDEGITMGEYIAAHGQCNMYIVGMTASAATVLCMKAKTVNMARGSMMLIHNASYDVGFYGSANKQAIDKIIDQFKKKRDDLDTIDKGIAEIYSAKNGRKLEDNLAMMDKEKWMLADDAKSFGLIDSIVEEEQQTAAAKNICERAANKAGFTEHFGLPEIPVSKSQHKSFWEKLREQLSGAVGIMNNVAPEEDININKYTKNMKKVVFNLLGGLLSVKDFEIGDDGKAAMTEDQLTSIENALKEKDGKITALTSEKEKAENEKKASDDAKVAAEAKQKEAEDKLEKLQKEFDDFKNEQGATSPSHVHQKPDNVPKNAKEMLEDIKGLL